METRTVIVTDDTGTEHAYKASGFDENGRGMLSITGSAGNVLAMLAPGMWRSVKVVKPDESRDCPACGQPVPASA